jgi:hypothetical protein
MKKSSSANWPLFSKDISLHLPPIESIIHLKNKKKVEKPEVPPLKSPPIPPCFQFSTSFPPVEGRRPSFLPPSFNSTSLNLFENIPSRRRPSHFDAALYLQQQPLVVPYSQKHKQPRVSDDYNTLNWLPKIRGRQASITVIHGTSSLTGPTSKTTAREYTVPARRNPVTEEDELDLMIRLSNLSAAHGSIDRQINDQLIDYKVRSKRIRLLALKKVEYTYARLQARVEERAKADKVDV